MSQYSSKGKAWEELRQRVLELYNWECIRLFPESCEGTMNLQVDHIIPKSRGGTDDIENLRVLCRRCNSRKKDKNDPIEKTWFSSEYFTSVPRRPLGSSA